jgi:anti-anti-sigma factor
VLDRTFQAEMVDGTLRVRGDVDDYGIIALRNLLAEHGTTPGGRLVVDLSEVAYLPSVAVGVLTRGLGQAQRAGADLVLLASPGTVAQRVLMVCALPYHETLDDAGPPDADVPA